MNIFEIQQSKTDKEFVLKNGSLEFEVFADIFERAGNLPYIGSLFKLGKVAINYMDYRFVRKLHFFLAESENIKQEKKEKFLNSLSQKDYKRINAMMTHLLYSAEEDGKATLMGKIYRSRLLGEIDDEMMLRLCSVVNKAFLTDLDHLEEYVKPNSKDNYITSNLYSFGLLRLKGPEVVERTLNVDGQYEVNEVGRLLMRIMRE